MRRQNRNACFRTSLGVGDLRLFPDSLHIATSLVASRQMMSVVEMQNAKRDRVWPRNHSCWIRAPESWWRTGLGPRALIAMSVRIEFERRTAKSESLRS